jgi:2-aminoadipate transaminase
MSATWEQRVRRAAASSRVINLGGGLPSAVQFPRAALASSFFRVLGVSDGFALQYGWAEGQESLRALVARRLIARGARVTADDVIITNGAQDAISIATQLLLRRGQSIGVEATTYPAALDLFRERGLRPVSLGQGRACYVMTSLNNPAGTALDAEVRASLLARGVPIIEDDAYGDLTFDGKTAPLLLSAAPGRTYHVGTFSKTLCPGLRVGWLVVPRAYRKRAVTIKEANDLQANSLAQAVVSDYLRHADFEQRLDVLRRFYRRRAALMARAVRRELPSWRFRFPDGGFCLWIDTDARVSERRFSELALEEGASFDAGSAFTASPAQGPTRLRLCFSLAAPETFERGVRRLARAWARATRAARHVRR